jgi:hypothetical protein
MLQWFVHMLQACVPNVSSVFQKYVANLCYLDVCLCFICMLQVFYLDIMYVYNGFQMFFSCVFSSVLDTCFKCFIYLFFMLQVLCLNISKIDQDAPVGGHGTMN